MFPQFAFSRTTTRKHIPLIILNSTSGQMSWTHELDVFTAIKLSTDKQHSTLFDYNRVCRPIVISNNRHNFSPVSNKCTTEIASTINFANWQSVKTCSPGCTSVSSVDMVNQMAVLNKDLKETALLYSQNFWMRWLDGHSNFVRVLSFDFSKAFDLVSHRVVID